jgi:hypothetical protein
VGNQRIINTRRISLLTPYPYLEMQPLDEQMKRGTDSRGYSENGAQRSRSAASRKRWSINQITNTISASEYRVHNICFKTVYSPQILHHLPLTVQSVRIILSTYKPPFLFPTFISKNSKRKCLSDSPLSCLSTRPIPA